MNNILLADKAIKTVIEKYQFQTVLDIGSGQGLHSEIFRNNLKTVISIDAGRHWGEPDIADDFIEKDFSEPFDLVWCSHVLEHQVNAQKFLKKIFKILKPGGILAITVPPMKPYIVGGHVSLWNSGLLLYNLILAGFSCKDAMVLQYDYNISIILRKSFAVLPPIKMDAGDIELLSGYFPKKLNAAQNFLGDINELNWNNERDERIPAGNILDAKTLDIQHFMDLPESHSNDMEALLWSLDCAELPGDVAEFGVFQGRSLSAMAQHQKLRKFHGFDSFLGLPEDWLRSPDSTYKKGHFTTKTLPEFTNKNIRLYPGFFTESIPVWKSTLEKSLALIHIDSDLYSSAKFILDSLNHSIQPGTIIVFDELCDWKNSGTYPAWREGEWRALKEWMAENNRSVRILTRGYNFSGTVVVAK